MNENSDNAPYLFLYIRYWQLINMVDEFVILDDVNYIKREYYLKGKILLLYELKVE